MKASGNFLGTAFGLALLFGLLAGGYFLFKYVGNVFATLEPQVEVLAAIASVVALLCAVIIAEGLKARGQKDNYPVATAEKAKTYERLLSLCCEQLKRQQSFDQPNANTDLVDIENFLALQGSSKVVSAYVEFRRLTRSAEAPADRGTTQLRKLLMEMRSDLGRADFIRSEKEFLEMLLERT